MYIFLDKYRKICQKMFLILLRYNFSLLLIRRSYHFSGKFLFFSYLFDKTMFHENYKKFRLSKMKNIFHFV